MKVLTEHRSLGANRGFDKVIGDRSEECVPLGPLMVLPSGVSKLIARGLYC